ncbi:MAG: ferrochelatase [Candidatus Thiodiazotropha weberae]|nr:ferrochelatase [Candidatus Thiodiazotropha lotti]MCG8013313.1 ferrochelatase [Candidatus Thiodiazotropha lotti]MCW4212788.1 ferrochelatase [Candidatus Thiodiazotropha lotti]MCW4218043.1 ferrochelatase [Candidatus Thiodiazotropha lotti]
MKYLNQKQQLSMPDGGLAILLINLGTPDAPTTSAVRRYLAEFLSDPRIVSIPKLIWRIILHGIILRVRPKRSAKAYASIWTDEGSPLLVISKQQRDAIEQAIDHRFTGQVSVALAMRYGNPSIADTLKQLREQNIQRLLVLPLYPQYSATTTASIFDAVTAELQQWRWIPEVRFIQRYHHESDYIDALSSQIADYRMTHGGADKLLFSFHGIPKDYYEAGDPYPDQCRATAQAVVDRLGLNEEQWLLAFQSRFGAQEWVKPYTDETLKQWAAEGIKSVQVVCPAFATDCLETLEEIGVENRDYFLQGGGAEYRYIPALNDDPKHIEMFANLIHRHALGWPEANPLPPVSTSSD